MLEGDERRHQLRDARHRHARIGVSLVEDVAGAAVRDEHCPGVDRRRIGRRRSRAPEEQRDEDRREDGEDALSHVAQAILGVMAQEQQETKPDRIRGVERSLQLKVRGLGGFELRPTRVFLWGGEERSATERILPLGSAPRSLTIPRRPRERRAGSVELTTLGNPVMTLALAGVHVARALRRRAAT